ncbi:MAG: hypothetical protein M1829_003422 [Trizodia sp. TS-e1964]|nr:MAG: hypothetical protein M1829_003422 [Trizodia sp. TS-e1964]
MASSITSVATYRYDPNIPPIYPPTLEPPPKPQDPAAYTNLHHHRTLKYITCALSRPFVSPRCQYFYRTLRVALHLALYSSCQPRRLSARATISRLESEINASPHLLVEQDPQNLALQHAIIELRQLQYYVRYGGELTLPQPRLLRNSPRAGIHGRELVFVKDEWTELAAALAVEASTIYKGNRDYVSIPAHCAVARACRDLALDRKLVVSSIIEYAQPSSWLFQDLEEPKMRGLYRSLAEVMYTDWHEIDAVFGDSDTGWLSVQGVVGAGISDMFDCDDFERLETWVPSGELRDIFWRASNALEKEEEVVE